MRIILTGLGEYGLDGEYELDRHPTGREMNRFRKDAEMSPSDLTDAIANGAVDVVRLYAHTALSRAGRADLASKVMDVPLDLLAGIEVVDDSEGDDENADVVQAHGVGAAVDLPPTSGSASSESEL